MTENQNPGEKQRPPAPAQKAAPGLTRNECRPSNNGEQNVNLPLARRPSSAIEKVAPGAKHILSGMVADTLGLVKKKERKKLRVVVLDDEEGPRRSCVAMLKGCWHRGAEIVEFEDARDAWRELSRTDPDIFITDIRHGGISCFEMLTWLAERKVKYSVLVISAVLGCFPDSVEVQRVRRNWRPNLNVSFLCKPWSVKEFRTALDTALRPPPDTASLDAEAMPGLAAQMESWCQNGEDYYYGRGVPKDYSMAAMWFRNAAEQGNANAQFNLARCYAFGQGVEQNRTEMLAWYRKAAEGRQPEAQWFLGRHYQRGDGVPKDLVEAAKWFRKSAEQGYAVAQDFLGDCYEAGRGVSQDFAEAAAWYSCAAAAGYVGGVLSLAKCQLEGRGVAQNTAEAIRVFKALAEEEDPTARYNLGLCYLHGKGVQRNPDEACKWFAHASLQGNKAAATELKLLIAGDEISQGTRRLYGKYAKRKQL
jgi:TPR repeat protein/FixJ family two-component response regulator